MRFCMKLQIRRNNDRFVSKIYDSIINIANNIILAILENTDRSNV